MTQHQHGPGCSHHAEDSNGNGSSPQVDTIGDATPFTIAFKYVAIASLIFLVALLLPLPGGAQTKTVLVMIGGLAGVCLFPLAYIQKKK